MNFRIIAVIVVAAILASIYLVQQILRQNQLNYERAVERGKLFTAHRYEWERKDGLCMEDLNYDFQIGLGSAALITLAMRKAKANDPGFHKRFIDWRHLEVLKDAVRCLDQETKDGYKVFDRNPYGTAMAYLAEIQSYYAKPADAE